MGFGGLHIHDNRVWICMSWYFEAEKHFSRNEYLISYSAFTPELDLLPKEWLDSFEENTHVEDISGDATSN